MLEEKVEEMKKKSLALINQTSPQPSSLGGEGVASEKEKIIPAIIDLNI